MNTPAPNDMPDEIWIYRDSEGIYHASLDEVDFSTFAPWIKEAEYIRADLRAPVAAGGEVERLREVARMVDQWGNGLRHHTAHESKMVKSARKALQQSPAPAVDLEKLKRSFLDGNGPYSVKEIHEMNGWNKCLDHLAASGVLKDGKRFYQALRVSALGDAPDPYGLPCMKIYHFAHIHPRFIRYSDRRSRA